MGIGPVARALYKKILPPPPLSMLDFGSQDFFDGDRQLESARDHFEKLGYEYECIDMDGRHGAWPLDMNVASAEGRGRFDLVANHGTSEHVFNQANVFRMIHDFCRPGGLMVHVVPAPKYGKHGFYFYDKTIFKDMAHANDYTIVCLYPAPDPNGELIVCTLRRSENDLPFRTPIQGAYR